MAVVGRTAVIPSVPPLQVQHNNKREMTVNLLVPLGAIVFWFALLWSLRRLGVPT